MGSIFGCPYFGKLPYVIGIMEENWKLVSWDYGEGSVVAFINITEKFKNKLERKWNVNIAQMVSYMLLGILRDLGILECPSSQDARYSPPRGKR